MIIKKLVFNIIRTHNQISRAELVRFTGMSPTSITRIVNAFLESEFLEEVGTVDGNVGEELSCFRSRRTVYTQLVSI